MFSCHLTLHKPADVHEGRLWTQTSSSGNIVWKKALLHENSEKMFEKTFMLQSLPWRDRELKKKFVKSIKLLRNTGRELYEKREAELLRGDPVPEDILTLVCRYKGRAQSGKFIRFLGSVCSSQEVCRGLMLGLTHL